MSDESQTQMLSGRLRDKRNIRDSYRNRPCWGCGCLHRRWEESRPDSSVEQALAAVTSHEPDLDRWGYFTSLISPCSEDMYSFHSRNRSRFHSQHCPGTSGLKECMYILSLKDTKVFPAGSRPSPPLVLVAGTVHPHSAPCGNRADSIHTWTGEWKGRPISSKEVQRVWNVLYVLSSTSSGTWSLRPMSLPVLLFLWVDIKNSFSPMPRGLARIFSLGCKTKANNRKRGLTPCVTQTL